MQRIRKGAAALLMLAYFLGIAGGMDGAVLCVGEHGHVAIEASHVGHCCSDADHHDDSAAPDSLQLSSSEDECGSCVDTPLTVARSVHTFAPRLNLRCKTPGDCPPPVFPVLERPTIGMRQPSPLLAVPRAMLCSLRTVVLII